MRLLGLAEMEATALVTVMVYVLIVTPSCAVTTTDIVLAPTLREMGADATPELTETVLTLIVAFAWFTVGVTVTLLVPLATLSVYVYVPVENDGLRVPELIVSPERAASALNADTLILVEAVVEVSVMSRVPAALPALRDSVAEVAFAVICETIDAPVPPDMVKTVVLPTGHAVFTPVMVTVLPVLL